MANQSKEVEQIRNIIYADEEKAKKKQHEEKIKQQREKELKDAKLREEETETNRQREINRSLINEFGIISLFQELRQSGLLPNNRISQDHRPFLTRNLFGRNDIKFDGFIKKTIPPEIETKHESHGDITVTLIFGGECKISEDGSKNFEDFNYITIYTTDGTLQTGNTIINSKEELLTQIAKQIREPEYCSNVGWGSFDDNWR